MGFFEKFRRNKIDTVQERQGVTAQDIEAEQQRQQFVKATLDELRAEDRDPRRQQHIAQDSMRLSEAAQEELGAIEAGLKNVIQHIETHGPTVRQWVTQHPKEFNVTERPWLGYTKQETSEGLQITFTFYGKDATDGTRANVIEGHQFSITHTILKGSNESAQRRIRRGTELWSRALVAGSKDIGRHTGFEVWEGK